MTFHNLGTDTAWAAGTRDVKAATSGAITDIPAGYYQVTVTFTAPANYFNATHVEVVHINQGLVSTWPAEFPALNNSHNTVTFDYNGGTNNGNAAIPVQIAHGDTIAAAPAAGTLAAPEGYEAPIIGWYTTEALTGTQWGFSSSKVLRPITLYARWTQKPDIPPLEIELDEFGSEYDPQPTDEVNGTQGSASLADILEPGVEVIRTITIEGPFISVKWYYNFVQLTGSEPGVSFTNNGSEITLTIDYKAAYGTLFNNVGENRISVSATTAGPTYWGRTWEFTIE
jgi:hypothetical protein